MATQEKVDVVIVGAGASGSVYAAVLAKAGKKVVVMDNGPDWQTSDLISSDIWGRRIKPAGAPFILEGKHPVSMGAQGGWGVGGAALHYFANFPRLLPNDFRIKSEHNRAHDWPISYDDVAPFYDKVAQEIGVSGDAKAEELWRPKGQAYPMPPMKTFKNGQVWLKGFEANGIRMVPAAVGMNSVEFKGRPACIYDGWCHVGCPIGALANPLVTFLSDARKAGAEVRAWSTVTRVLTDASGNKVTGVEYYDQKHEKQVQPANVVVLAAWGGAEPAPAAQLRGRQARQRPRQFRRPRRQVRHDPLRLGHQRDVRRGRGEPPWAPSAPSTCPMSATARPPTRARSARPSSSPASPARSAVSAASPIRGRICSAPALHAYMKRAIKNLTRITAFGEEQPKIENRLELASDKDEFGMPLGRIIHNYDDNDAALWNANFEEGLKIAKATDAKDVWQVRAAQPTIHFMGGTIMGTGAGNSVVNSFGQTHEIPNLYVAGPGIFATAGASNPTYTIFALSLRGAENLAKTWSTVAG